MRFRNQFVALFSLLSLLSGGSFEIASADSPPSTNENEEVNKPVSDWFAKYDEIRRDAEMTMGEKLKYGNALKKGLKTGGKLSKSTQEFVERMRAKYEAASVAMKALSAVPETKELQDGYVQYFIEMERTFSECLSMQEVTPDSTQAKSQAKEKLEKLNAKNKKLDEELRVKFDIPKHKHS